MQCKYLGLLLTFIVCSTQLSAQKEAYNWLFGHKAGLTWNTTRSFGAQLIYGGSSNYYVLKGLPTEIPSSMITLEGCFSLSNSKGDLLFYSDGSTIWNKNGIPMNTKLLSGNSSSAQSGIVLPYPGNKNKYLAISLSLQDNNNMAYTVVDMSLNNGLGGIVGEINNSFSGHQGLLGESVSAIPHSNGTDYWVVAPGKKNLDYTYFNAWLISKTGVATKPISTKTPVIIDNANAPNGYFKFSPDKKHFVWATWGGKKLVFGDFNPQTAGFSNIREIKSTNQAFYGVEFSLSGRYLYVTETPVSLGTTNNYLYIFDFAYLLSRANSYAAQLYFDNGTVKKIPFISDVARLNALQMGPDGRIYAAGGDRNGNGGPLHVIENPDDISNLKIYKISNFWSGVDKNKASFGLPSFSQSWFNSNILGENEFCAGSTQYEFDLTITRGFGSEKLAYTRWDFGNGNGNKTVNDYNVYSGAIQSQTYAYKHPGTYTITISFHEQDGKEITTLRQTFQVTAKSCVLPVNPNVRVNLN